MELFSIKINRTGQYISWFDDNWYETTSDPTPRFTIEQIKKAHATLPKHYIYKYTILDENDVACKPRTDIPVPSFAPAPVNVQPKIETPVQTAPEIKLAAEEQVIAKPKKSLFKLKIKV